MTIWVYDDASDLPTYKATLQQVCHSEILDFQPPTEERWYDDEYLADQIKTKNVHTTMMCVRSVQHLGPGGGKYWLFRLVRSIAHANDVVLVLDGDDILHHPKALTIVNQKYLDTNAWFTYGSYTGKWSDQIINLSSDIRQHRTPFLPRNQTWVYGHPRTFKTFFLDHLRKMILNISTGRGLRKERIVASFIICSNLRVRRKLDTLPRRFTRIITYPRRQPWPQPPKKNDCLN